MQATESLNRMEALDPRVLCISHFGFHDDAVKWLKDFKRQVMLWERLASEGGEYSRTLTETYLTVLDADPSVRKLVSTNPEAEGRVYSSLAGFVSYARWAKSRK